MSQHIPAVGVAAVRVADDRVLSGDVREALEVHYVGELVAASPDTFDYVLANPPFGKKSSMTFTTDEGEAEGELGDARCGVDLDDPAFKATGSVTAVIGDRSFAASGLGGFAAGWFTLGRLTWTSGPNAGRLAEVASHDVSGVRRVTLLEAPVRPIAVGDDFVVHAGCDKRPETCSDRFANVVNFRGFPHIPGQDTVIRYPNRGDANSGDVL